MANREDLEEAGVDLWEYKKYRDMPNEEALAEIRRIEQWADETLFGEESWDIYFCLMHECHMRGFLDDFDRLVSKIDTNKYKPWESKNAGVRLIVRERIAMIRELDDV